MARFPTPRFSTLMLGVLTVAGILAAPAARAIDSFDKQFRMMDANKDGKVSAREHAAGARKMFVTMDSNKNGKVTATEMASASKRITGQKASGSDLSAEEKIKVVDSNGDGVLTAAEHAAASRAMFATMDTDLDGFLSKDELAAGHTAMLKK